MSVIGRLDGQVEEVIIKPAGRRHRAPDERAAPETTPAAPTAPRDEPRETHHAEQQDETPRGGGELPVWLL